jgi:transcriptional regulator with XRE-family HTH domain
MRSGTKLARPEWAVKIEQLRERLHLNQAGLARLLKVSPMAVSRWERAINEPESAYYLQLGTLSGDPDCWFFWQRAGLAPADLSRALRRGAQHAKARAIAENIERKGTRTAAVPLLNCTAATSGAGDADASLESLPAVGEISVPEEWTPTPATTRCIRLRGIDLEPEVPDGTLIAVDLAQNNLATLDGHLVLLWHKDFGLRVQRLGDGGANVSGHAPSRPLERGASVLGRIIWYVVRSS